MSEFLRSTPAHNYYMIGPGDFGPFGFIVSDDQRAEVEFQRWLAGDTEHMPIGVRPAGKYTLWQQPVPDTLTVEDQKQFLEAARDSEDDRLIEHCILPIVYGQRPAVPYDEYRFIGHVRNFHAGEEDESLELEDIFVLSPFRPDRIILFGVYAIPTEKNPAPWWTLVFNTTMPIYAPTGEDFLSDLSALLDLEFRDYRSTSIH